MVINLKTISNMLPLLSCINFSFFLFLIGLIGIIWNQRNFLIMILCIELMFFSIALNFTFFAVYTTNSLGQIFSLLTVTVATTDTTIGLSLLIIASRLGSQINYNSLVSLRG